MSIDNDLVLFGSGFFVALILTTTMLLPMLDTHKESFQKEATDHNAAEWRINPKTGEKTFVWLTQPESEKP